MTAENRDWAESSNAERVARLARLWRMVADAELAPLGLTHSRWSVLWKLYRMGQQTSQKDLAEALEIELASLMRTLSQLEQQALIERHCCEHDKRVRRVSLTQAGLDLLAFIRQRIIDLRAELYQGVSPEQLEAFEFVLNRISENAVKKLHPTATDKEEK
ncbi:MULTISPECIES: transcriptional regulator SlyA [Shewanella]|uniref:transcriptional regulator SlyA n=1 Tax=Shewanella TaxID=22 RepID=UPI001C662332|nr:MULTISPECIES: transcriptional regulator SlyA [Shewanella]QYJ84109.1 transcriptional regulator SlyA [Shewanella aegiceratis]QYJ95510.1 transcriptional regulator SlyA [Shewanella spartinae]